jgi:protein TonB
MGNPLASPFPASNSGGSQSGNGPLLLSLLGALLLHAALIFGIVFEHPLQPPPLVEPERMLDVMVVQNPQPDLQPDQADFLAQVDQQGGGNLEERARPTTLPEETAPPEAPKPAEEEATAQEETPPPPAPEPDPEPVEEPTPEPPAPPQPVPEVETPTPQEPEPEPEPPPAPKPPPPRQPEPREPEPEPVETAPAKKRVSAADLLRSTQQEIARLTAEIDRRASAYAKRPRRKFISARTREYQYASYMDAWRRKVERVGNLNYPQRAKQERLFGSLVLTVAIRADGSVERLEIDRSSGHRLLDDAAKNIVTLAAPYAPLPENIRRETDILHITRTWHFRESNQLTSK